MVKTIEQQAEEFADAMVKGALGTRNDYYDSYIKGAIDQRKRDVELFGEWLEEHVMDYVSYDHLNGIDIDYSNITKGLRKAMEDKQ